jgi:two-component system sensor histidine kinase MprB
MIEVADTGSGIARGDLSHIFDRFYRAKAAPINSSAGSGLGLSLARWIAHQHSAELTVEANLPRGSSFRLLLPKPGAAVSSPSTNASITRHT